MKSQRKYNLGFIVGRFQMLHVGHEHLINIAREQCENLLVLVGSAQEHGTLRNPFDVELRCRMLIDLYEYYGSNVYIGFISDLTHENDHSHVWGKFLLRNVEAWRLYYGIDAKLDCMVYGNDEERNDWFDPSDILGISQIKVDRANIPISATQMRGYIAWNQYGEWAEYTNPVLHQYYNTLRQKLGVIT